MTRGDGHADREGMSQVNCTRAVIPGPGDQGGILDWVCWKGGGDE